jgi:hypothetical protein
MILAQLQSADPIHIRDILIVLGFLISSVASVLAVTASRRTQHRDVRLEEGFVTASHCLSLHTPADLRLASLEKQVSDVRHEISVTWQAIDAADERRASEIHKRLDDISENMPSRIIALLKNTGAIS